MFNDVAAVAKETDCMVTYVRKGVALACFYFARCLHRGLGIKKNPPEASKYYSRVSDQSHCS
jgi:TPR repeat protein